MVIIKNNKYVNILYFKTVLLLLQKIGKNYKIQIIKQVGNLYLTELYFILKLKDRTGAILLFHCQNKVGTYQVLL